MPPPLPARPRPRTDVAPSGHDAVRDRPARVSPRPECLEHGVKTAEVPWAGKHARFTWLFEAFAIEVIREALKTALRPVVKVANTLKSNLRYLLNYYDSFISNALTEGFNSKIQTMKADARGYRNFAHYRTSILFFCGGLNLLPALQPLPLSH